MSGREACRESVFYDCLQAISISVLKIIFFLDDFGI